MSTPNVGSTRTGRILTAIDAVAAVPGVPHLTLQTLYSAMAEEYFRRHNRLKLATSLACERHFGRDVDFVRIGRLAWMSRECLECSRMFRRLANED